MTERAPTIELLLTLSRSEAQDSLESIVVEEFRTTLLMAPDEDVPLDAGFFDELGLTSLRLTEIKRRLEDRLGCDISANVLFNQPTVRQLVDYLAGLVWPEGPTASAGSEVPIPDQAAVSGQASAKELLDDILEDLYRA